MVLSNEDLIYSLFANRTDYYAEQFLTQQGKKGFKKVKGVITPQLIREHLNQKIHLGFYQLSQDSKVKWGCLDFDKNTLEDFEKAKDIYQFALSKGYHPAFEYSGGGDYKVHIWFFSKEPIPAKQMRLFLENICNESKVRPNEIFPKQDEVQELGNLVKLPFGLHLVTKKKSCFCKSGFEPILDEEELNQKLQVHLLNKDEITEISPVKEPVKPVIDNLKPHRWDSFFSQILKQSIPEGVSKEVKIGCREAGINNNIIKNQARWFFEKGYNQERLTNEIKPIYDSNNWAFGDLLGWFKKCERGDILQINEKELQEWSRSYYPSLEIFFPQKEERNVEVSSYDIKTYEDFKNLKKERNYIIDGFLYPGSVTMVYSPPAQFKSLIACGMGLAISNGKNFLGMKTKKCPVLYGDGENAKLTIKDRLQKLHRGLNLKRNKFPYYTLTDGLLMDEKKNIHLGFSLFIEQQIEQKGIKVLIFDTMHRFAYYDENSSDDINRLYTKFFKPLAEKYNVAIVFLHHSTKTGGYRGSGDFLGMVDVSYQIKRKPKTNQFTILNEKSRNGEITDIEGEITFEEDYIRITRLNSAIEKEKTINKLKELTEIVKAYFESKLNGQALKKKDVQDYLEIKEVSFSESTLKRVLKFLVDNLFLQTDDKGKYWRNQI